MFSPRTRVVQVETPWFTALLPADFVSYVVTGMLFQLCLLLSGLQRKTGADTGNSYRWLEKETCILNLI